MDRVRPPHARWPRPALRGWRPGPGPRGGLPGAALLACLLVLLAAGSAAALEWRVTPEAGVELGHTDNVELAPQGEEETDAVLATAVGGRLRVEGRRTEGSAELRLERLTFRDNAADHDDRVHLLAAGTAPVGSDLLSLSGQAAVEDVFIDAQDGISTSRFNTSDNRGRVRLYRVRPALQDRLGRWGEYELSYARAHVNLPTRTLDDTDTDEVGAVLKSGPAFSRFLWALSYDAERTEHRLLSTDSRRWLATLDVEIGLVGEVYLVLGAGEESIKGETLPEPIAGTIAQAGFAWRPSPRLRLLATAAERFDDTVYGLDFATVLGSRFTLRAQHDEGLQSAQRLLRTDLGYLGATPQGTLQNRRRAEAFTVGDRTFGLALDSFRQERSTAALRWRAARNALRLDAFRERRTFLLTEFVHTGKGGTLGWERALSRATQVATSVSRETVEFRTAEPREDKVTYGILEATHRLSRRLRVRLAYRHSERESNDPAGDLQEHVYTLGIFGSL